MSKPRTDAELVVELIEGVEHLLSVVKEVHDLAKDIRGDEGERIVKLTEEFVE